MFSQKMIVYVAAFALFNMAIVLHELGHLLAAVVLGIPVSDFSVGFGPSLWFVTAWGIRWHVRMLPLGGYVWRDKSKKRRAAVWRKVVYYLAGPLANLISTLFATFGYLIIFHSITWRNAVLGSVAIIYELLSSVISDFKSPQNFAGTIGVVRGGATMVGSHETAIYFFAIINLSFCVLNLMPLYPLDGGRIAGKLLLSKRFRSWHAIVTGIVVALFIAYINLADIARFF